MGLRKEQLEQQTQPPSLFGDPLRNGWPERRSHTVGITVPLLYSVEYHLCGDGCAAQGEKA